MMGLGQERIIRSGLVAAKDMQERVSDEIAGERFGKSLSKAIAAAIFMRINDLYVGAVSCIEIYKPVNAYV